MNKGKERDLLLVRRKGIIYGMWISNIRVDWMKEGQFRIACLSGLTGKWEDSTIWVLVSPAVRMGSITDCWDDLRAVWREDVRRGDTQQEESPLTTHLPLECKGLWIRGELCYLLEASSYQSYHL